MIVRKRDLLGLGLALAFAVPASAQMGESEPQVRPDGHVYFAPRSSVLAPEALETLELMKPIFDHAAKTATGPVIYEVVGAYDGAETPALAARRVKAVADWLIASGVDTTVIRTRVLPPAEAPVRWVKGQPNPINRSVHLTIP